MAVSHGPGMTHRWRRSAWARRTPRIRQTNGGVWARSRPEGPGVLFPPPPWEMSGTIFGGRPIFSRVTNSTLLSHSRGEPAPRPDLRPRRHLRCHRRRPGWQPGRSAWLRSAGGGNHGHFESASDAADRPFVHSLPRRATRFWFETQGPCLIGRRHASLCRRSKAVARPSGRQADRREREAHDDAHTDP